MRVEVSGFDVDPGDLNSGCHAPIASELSLEPSPVLRNATFVYYIPGCGFTKAHFHIKGPQSASMVSCIESVHLSTPLNTYAPMLASCRALCGWKKHHLVPTYFKKTWALDPSDMKVSTVG